MYVNANAGIMRYSVMNANNIIYLIYLAKKRKKKETERERRDEEGEVDEGVSYRR